MNDKQRDGYSLVEVSLALLVAGFGVMAAFALFPEALGQSRKSVEATEIATFADFVFAGLEVKAASTNATAWNGFEAGTLNMSHALLDADERAVKINDPSYPVFHWKPFWYGDDVLPFTYFINYRVASFTYTLRVESLPPSTMKGARLEVWAGEIPAPPAFPGKVFYRQFVPLR